ncbi:MAG: serine/threonine protein kinase, partial [Aureliella sp.]
MKPNHDPISTGASVEDDFAVLVEQLIQRSQLQEPIDWTALVEQYPDHKTQLLNLKPTLQALLDLSRSLAQVGTTDGVTNLGKGIPATLGDYRLLGEIGRGGMGIVYEAEQVSLRRRVAVKVLPRSALLDTQRLQRFRNEAIAAATLNHKNIVPIHSVDCEGDLHYYSMQLISGHTLHNVIKCLRERVIPGS